MDIALILIIVFLPLAASLIIQSKYKKYSQVDNDKKLSGFEVARKILDENNLQDIHIVEVKGSLSDHYDSKRKVVRLSTNIFHDNSIASLAVAAHECGHAIQDKEGYLFLRVRNFIFPIVNICSRFAYIVILLGFLSEFLQLIYLGIALVGVGLIFQIITLPVEFNASKMAKEKLKKHKLVNKEEIEGVHSVLTAAAWTYVAGTLATIAQMLRLFLIGRRKD